MIDSVFEKGLSVIKKIQETQKEALDQSAEMIAECFVSNHHFYVSGSGHSHTVAEEFYGRAGGLAFVIPILTTELTLTEHPTKSSYIERLPGYASILCDLYKIGKDDVVLIASNSGRNAYPVELALCAKEKGAKVIGITSLKHSRSTPSRHSSGKHLEEVADIVIDNCGEIGDACLKLENLEMKMCPTSSMANSFIVQAISVQCAKYIIDKGKNPPVFVSLNNEGSEHVNDEYFETYTRQYVNKSNE